AAGQAPKLARGPSELAGDVSELAEVGVGMGGSSAERWGSFWGFGGLMDDLTLMAPLANPGLSPVGPFSSHSPPQGSQASPTPPLTQTHITGLPPMTYTTTPELSDDYGADHVPIGSHQNITAACCLIRSNTCKPHAALTSLAVALPAPGRGLVASI
ncbi:hypothetical protein E4T56_gene6523, partial [Termitomyces sp. T112]